MRKRAQDSDRLTKKNAFLRERRHRMAGEPRMPKDARIEQSQEPRPGSGNGGTSKREEQGR